MKTLNMKRYASGGLGQCLKHSATVSLLVCLLIGLAPSGVAEDREEMLTKQDYPGSRDRQYLVHLPANYGSDAEPRPLVMVLHGCCEDHKTIQKVSNFDEVADREGFIVVYPYITSYPSAPNRIQNCWGFWIPEQIHSGAGEVQDLGGILSQVINRYRVDTNRVHITGLSSGGGMAVAAMVVHSQLIASGASAEGLPYSETASSVGNSFQPGVFKPVSEVVEAMKAEMGSSGRAVPLFIVQSADDDTVNAKAGYNLRDSWGQTFGINTSTPVTSESGTTHNKPWEHRGYGETGQPTMVETFIVHGLKHGWYGGRPGPFSFPDAPNMTEKMWAFFKVHPLQQPLKVAITSAEAQTQTQTIVVRGTLSSEGPLAGVKVMVELSGRAPQPSRPAEVDVAGKLWTFTSAGGLSNNVYYRPRVTAVGAGGTSAIIQGEPIALGQPDARPPEVTIDSLTNDLQVLKVAGQVKDDFGMDRLSVGVRGGCQSNLVLNGAAWLFNADCLAEGTNIVEVRALDKDTLETVVARPVVVTLPYDAKESATLTEHLVAQRLRLYGTQFGAGDVSYLELYQAQGNANPFWLYRARGTQDWYADYRKIPQLSPQ